MFYKAKLTIIAICLLPITLQAKDVEYVELQSRTTKLHMSYMVNNDFTVVKTSEIEIKALSDDVVEDIKEQRFSHSTSIEKLEILEAYTKKANGKRIDVPKDNYQVTINKGKGDDGAIFSDRTRVTIVFPELEKNDSVYMKVKNTETEPMFPGYFAVSNYFWSQRAYDDVTVRFDLPEDMVFRKQVRGMTETVSVKKGRKLITLGYRMPKPVKIDRQNYSVWDESKEAGYAFSTFADYESLAKAYGKRALPKTMPTARVKKLAKKIVGSEKGKRAKARLLYDWVASNVTYGGNCIGVGAVVPHNTDFILDNRMGDCKDHATLLGALFNAVGIQNTQALINAGSVYSLPMIPVVTSVNHVITYIPEWDMFVDSTNPTLPFGTLNFSLSDKPVILVEGDKPLRRTPATRVGDNVQEIESSMTVQSDGSITGDIHVKAKGHPAIKLRAAWRHSTKKQEAEWLKKVFSSQYKIGSATVTKDDPVPLLPEYSFSLEFNRPDFVLPEGVDGFYIYPLIPTPMAIHSLLDYPNEEIEGYDVFCSNGRSIEKLTYEFPDGFKILAKPENFEIDENYIRFTATYALEGNVLKVEREMNDKTPGNVCSADLINRQRQTLIKITKNMRTKVIYQR